MKEKNIKFILELIFIFIIPLVLLATCFKQEKVYDENNNEVEKYLTFNNIFVFNDETIQLYKYESVETLVESTNNFDFWNNHKSDDYLYIYIDYSTIATESIFFKYGSSDYSLTFDVENDFETIDNLVDFNYDSHGYIITDEEIVYNNKTYIKYDKVNGILNNYNLDVDTEYNNSFKFLVYSNVFEYVPYMIISDNVINRFISYIYDTLGISTNWVLQFIVIYTLLWLVMWFIWHILYLPLDFICSKLLFDRVDK